jgi:hypothetical protein
LALESVLPYPAPTPQKSNDAGNVGLTKLKDMRVFRDLSA